MRPPPMPEFNEDEYMDSGMMDADDTGRKPASGSTYMMGTS